MGSAGLVDVHENIAISAKGDAFALAIPRGRRVVALIAEGQGSDSAGEIDALVVTCGGVGGGIARSAGNMAMGDAEDGGAGSAADIADSTDAN